MAVTFACMYVNLCKATCTDEHTHPPSLLQKHYWPVSPFGNPNCLDNVHYNLEEKDKKEEKEAEGAVRPKEEKNKKDIIVSVWHFGGIFDVKLNI